MNVRRVTVVVADDDDEFRAALIDTLVVDPGIEVVGQGTDAAQAVALCSSHRPDVALVDVRMPEGGGERAAEEIPLVSPDTHVVAVSAFDSAAVRRRMEERGVVAYLVKGMATGPELRAVVLGLARVAEVPSVGQGEAEVDGGPA